MRKVACYNLKDKQLLDHIAPLAYILDAPLFIEQERNYQITKKYYPYTKTLLVNPKDFYSIAKNYTSLIECKFWALDEIQKMFLNEKLKLFYCPHGNSDKGYIKKEIMELHATQDGCLLYGNHMIDLLKKQNLFNELKSYAIVGNFRLAYYLKFKSFYDDLVKKEILTKFKNPKNKIVLYAPTWKDAEDSTSFFDVYANIKKTLPDNLNLIVKLHPLLEERNPKEFYKVYEDKQRSNVIHLNDFPLIYPILNITDIYLGDFSSVGYDFLSQQKPMFFLDSFQRNFKKDPSLLLHSCGEQIPKKHWINVFDYIKKHESKNFAKIQKKTYEYAFGKFLKIFEIKKNIFEIL